MFCVEFPPTTQIGLAVLGLGETLPPLHDVKVKPATLEAVSLNDWVEDAPPGMPVPFPELVAVIVPEPVGEPVQFVVLRSDQSTDADAAPDVLMLTFPSVNVVVATAPDAPVAVT